MAEPHQRPSALQLIAALPFVVFLFILPFPGTVALRLICLIAACLVALAHWRRLAALPLRWPILLWAGVVLASLLTAVDPGYSWREIKNEVGYCLLAFVAFFAWTRGREQLGLALIGLAAAFAVIAPCALYDYVSDYDTRREWPAEAFYGGAGSVSAWLAAVWPALLLAGLFWFPRRATLWIGLIGFSFVLLVLANGQRILWPVIGLQGALFMVWLVIQRHQLPSWLQPMRLLLAAFGLAAVLATGFLLVLQSRGVAGSEVDLAADPRPAVWKAVGERILENPWTGAGFGRRVMAKAHPDLVPRDFPAMWHAHSLVLNYGLSAGVPGIVAIMLLFAALGTRFWRLSLQGPMLDRLVAMAGIAMVAGVFARNTVNDFFVRDGALLFWALAGMLLGYLLRPEADQS
jgi:O-antigen ligase